MSRRSPRRRQGGDLRRPEAGRRRGRQRRQSPRRAARCRRDAGRGAGLDVRREGRRGAARLGGAGRGLVRDRGGYPRPASELHLRRAGTAFRPERARPAAGGQGAGRRRRGGRRRPARRAGGQGPRRARYDRHRRRQLRSAGRILQRQATCWSSAPRARRCMPVSRPPSLRRPAILSLPAARRCRICGPHCPFRFAAPTRKAQRTSPHWSRPTSGRATS